MYMYMYMCVCVCVSLCLLCGAVSRRVSHVVARYVLFVVRDWSLVVDCPSLCCALLSACCCCCCFGLLLVIGVSACEPCIALLLSYVLVACGIKWSFLTPPCVHSKSPCVYVQNVPCIPAPHAHVFQHVRVVPVHTGRFERTHGDVLSGHTAFFSVSHHSPHRNHTVRHNTPQHTTHHNTTRRQTERERKRRSREREEKIKRSREDEREDEREEDKGEKR